MLLWAPLTVGDSSCAHIWATETTASPGAPSSGTCAGAEVGLNAGLRKRDFLAQKDFILLTDLAHNLLADFYHQALVGTRFQDYGLKRIVRDLLAMPGRLVFEAGELKRIELLSLKQNAGDLLICLEKYCFGD